MSKPLLNVKPAGKVEECRTSKSDEVCRYLLYYFAEKIGSRTLALVQRLLPDNISEAECRVLEDVITLGVFSDQEIERAAGAALQNTRNLFNRFLVTLFWE